MPDVSDCIGPREHISVLAINSKGLVLVVQKEGYYEKLWRLPHCARTYALATHAAGQHRIDESAIKTLLKRTIACDESGVGQMRDTGERAHFTYPKDTRVYDSQTTLQLYRDQDLVFYTAELLCPDDSLKKGQRVVGFTLAKKENVAGFLTSPEREAVLRIMENYVVVG